MTISALDLKNMSEADLDAILKRYEKPNIDIYKMFLPEVLGAIYEQGEKSIMNGDIVRADNSYEGKVFATIVTVTKDNEKATRYLIKNNLGQTRTIFYAGLERIARPDENNAIMKEIESDIGLCFDYNPVGKPGKKFTDLIQELED